MRRIIFQLFPQPFNINRQRIVIDVFPAQIPDRFKQLVARHDLIAVRRQN